MPFDILGAIFFFASIILYFLYYDNRTKKEELEKENENLREELLQLRNEHYNLSNELYKKSNDDFWHCVHLAVQHTQTKVPWVAKYKSEELTDIIVEHLSYAKVSEPKDIVLEGFEKKIRIALCASKGWLDVWQDFYYNKLTRLLPNGEFVFLSEVESDMLSNGEYDFVLETLPKEISPEQYQTGYKK